MLRLETFGMTLVGYSETLWVKKLEWGRNSCIFPTAEITSAQNFNFASIFLTPGISSPKFRIFESK